MKWKPIESAPRDGFFLVGRADKSISWTVGDKTVKATKPGYVCEVHRLPEGEQFAFRSSLTGDELVCDKPTHWMPLPEPPQEKADE